MDHVDLTPYPFPDGMAIPRLMPDQDKPFNGDGYLAAEVLRLKEAHGLTKALETGTCLGSTTLWLAENFETVWTCEVSDQFYEIASARFTMHQDPHQITDGTDRFWNNIIARKRESKRVVWNDADRVDFIFLDAHWGPNCPLLDELAAIANPEHHYGMPKPVIIIHDVMVPGHPELGYDRMPDGRPFSFELVRPHLESIYGVGNYSHHFNSKSEGAMRGVLYIEPK